MLRVTVAVRVVGKKNGERKEARKRMERETQR